MERVTQESYKQMVKGQNRASDALQTQIRKAEEITPPPIKQTLGMRLVDAVVNAVNSQLDFSEKEIKAGLGTKLKPYLNAEELKQFTWIFLTAGYGDIYRYALSTYGNMTKKEHRHLKTAITHLKKFSAEVLDRMDERDVERITKRSASGVIKIFDRDTYDKFQKATGDVMKHVVMDRNSFEGLSEVVMRQMCKNCELNRHQCELHSVLSNAFVPESTWDKPNCPYAYGDSDSAEQLGGVVEHLLVMRDERLDFMDKVGSQQLKDMCTQQVSALNKAIELAVQSKNK